jgi:hypothetical protein
VTAKDQRNANGAALASNPGFGSDKSGVRLEESERVFIEFIDVSRIRILLLKQSAQTYCRTKAVCHQTR